MRLRPLLFSSGEDGSAQVTYFETDKGHVTDGLDFGVEVKEGIEAHFELGFDLFAASFKDMHGDVSLIAVSEGDGSFAYRSDLVGGQQSHSVD